MLMQGSPPPPGEQVTLANWQDPPYNRWVFSHIRELMPTKAARVRDLLDMRLTSRRCRPDGCGQ